MAVALDDPRVDSLRTHLTSIAPSLTEEVEAALREALKATKTVRASRKCVKCSCTHIDYVDVQDSAKVMDAIKLTIEQTEGRPGVAGDEGTQGVQITRQVDHLDAPQLLALLDAGDVTKCRELIAAHAT